MDQIVAVKSSAGVSRSDSLMTMYGIVHHNTKEFIGEPQCRITSNA